MSSPNSSLPRSSSRRRPSVIDVTSKIHEEDIKKSLLAAKTPNIISKRRGSAVSIESIKSNSRRSSIMILSQPMNTDEFIKSSDFSPSKMHFPPPPPPTLSQHAQQQQQQQHSRSLSTPIIPSFKSQRPLIPSINYDNHNQYKKRAKISSRKLTNFFGDKPPIDICVREIEKEGLKAILHSKIPLCYFLYSLLEEYSCENLFFFLEVEQYESFDFLNSTQQYTTAQHIFDTYLTRNSQFEVNIDDKVRKSVIASIKSQRDPRNCFDDAKRAIFVLLEVSFARFIRSPTAELMKQEIGVNTTHYSESARDAAIFMLFRYLEKQNASPPFLSSKPTKPFMISTNKHTDNEIDIISPLPSPSLLVSQKRNDLIRTMIHEFLKTLLEIDVEHFYYENFSRNNKNKSSEKVNEIYYSGGNGYGNRIYTGGNGTNGGYDDDFDIWSNDDECIEMMNTGKKISTRDQLKKKPFRRPTMKSGRKI
ncbi:82_t:CDS:2 [Funneliformis mosseae]|uniref:82_t:CDS:1 n=1 Tax=Funneliformis mosseae TaxID=27381 RepID=A0A9N9GRT4_FUNMO|nr:82_t:CDS:2 [Funneliformis mosseae]